MLEIKGLVKQYGDFTAVDHLDLTVAEGEVFGFVGPNGAGKTTTMRIMAGLLGATSGSVHIDGIDVIQNPLLLREKIGYMPDFFGVYDNLKVSEYMDFYAGAYQIPYREREAIINPLLDLVNLADKKDEYVDVLSRGMKQRLCLARSLVHDPKLLILDEPASGLDPRARVEMKEALKQLQTLGKTILISSHILPELAQMCTQVGIMDSGKLLVQGSVNDIMARLSQKRVVSVKTTGDLGKIVYVLQENPLVRSIVQHQGDLEFDFEGTDEDLAEILRGLVMKGIPITHFKEKEGDLEDVFMEVTGGVAL